MMDKITLTLSAQTYHRIVQAVQDLPWKIATPIFQEIDPQVRAALAKEGLTEAPAPGEAGPSTGA